jgi:hypothetical protein
MNAGLMLVSLSLGAALLAGCDQTKQAEKRQENPVPVVMGQPTPQVQETAAVPATVSQPTPKVPASAPASAKDGKAPIQGQVDPKEPAQRSAFETK